MAPSNENTLLTRIITALATLATVFMGISAYLIVDLHSYVKNKIENHDNNINAINIKVAENTVKIATLEDYYKLYHAAAEAARDSNIQLTAK